MENKELTYEELRERAINEGIKDTKVSIGMWAKIKGYKKLYRKIINNKFTWAVVNGEQTFWYDESNLKKGSTVLVYNHDSDEWIITTCTGCSPNMPILVADKNCIIAINSELIGILSEND